jgi:DNA-binding response OmpR family regulator/tRNA A-37 threonylcarbamoyl transferase component Bud32
MAKLLIIEDEPRIVVGLRDNFEYEGYEVITAETGYEGIKHALNDSPDLILLDVMFPKITCVELKTRRPFLPVIVLTGRHHPSDEEKGNELGADDYVSRPFSMRELSARVKALLRPVHATPRKSDVNDPPSDLVESDTLEADSGASEKARISTVKSVKSFSRNGSEALSPNRPAQQKLLAKQLQATRPSDFERVSSADSTFAIGLRLGHYRILTRIGAGGMGVVYMALDERLNRRVALKRLNARRLTDKLARVQLLEEARNASSLNHPNICTIYDIGEVDDEIYMVMELIDGQPLSRLIAERSLPTGDIISYGIQIADALEHAHSHGIVHRDLKSSNVVVRADGVAKVVDFGLSRRFEHQPPDAITVSLGPHNSLGIIVGTIQYLAPEVLRGNIADERSDVWSFGVVLYELAAAALPFGGETAFSVGAAILQQSPAPLSGLLPLGLRTVIEGCLSKNVIDRYQGFAEIASELRAIRALSSTVVPLALQLAKLRLCKSTHRILRQ